MFKTLVLGFVVVMSLVGCASVPMETKDASDQVKQFLPPAKGMAGLYIFRSSGIGTALKKDVWVDGKCIGETAPNMFFFEEVAGDQEHTISTESEFSPNDLKLKTDRDTNYFIRQYIRLGVFVGGANLETVAEAEGKKIVQGLALAKKGTCSQ